MPASCSAPQLPQKLRRRRTININVSTLYYLFRKWRTTGRTENISRCGRPKSFTIRACRQPKSIVKSHRFSSLEIITRMFNEGKEKQLSKKTISRELNKLGFWARRPNKKPLVSNRKRIKRISFQKLYKKWGSNNWKNIIFSDESRFRLYSSDGRAKVWRGKEERFLPECTQKTLRCGSGSLMFWGFISWDKIGSLVEIKNNQNTKNYIVNILGRCLKTWRIFRRRRKSSQSMQDNAPCHKSKQVIHWFGQKKVDVLEWPPQSPDLNPIETIWNDLLLAVRKEKTIQNPSTIYGLPFRKNGERFQMDESQNFTKQCKID